MSWSQLRKPLHISLLVLVSAYSLFFYYRTLKIEHGQKNAYYHFEYDALVASVEKHEPIDFEAARAWRRGPVAHLWMLPVALTVGSDLTSSMVSNIQIFLVLLTLFLTWKVFGTPGRLFYQLPWFACLWLTASAFRYRIHLQDINSLWSFCIFSLVGYWFYVNKAKTGPAASLFTIAGHTRLLPILTLPVFFVVSPKRTVIWTAITTIAILLLGTLFIDPKYGYLYWAELVSDMLGKSSVGDLSGFRGAAYAWHESISIPSVLLKFAYGFYYAPGKYQLEVTPQGATTLINIARMLQVILAAGVLYCVFQHRKARMRLESDPKASKELRLVEVGFASLLTYILAPEYGNDFLITLSPLFCVGLYFVLNYGSRKNLGQILLFGFSVLLTFNVISIDLLATVFRLETLSQLAGNDANHFIPYEIYNVFCLPIVGVVLMTVVLFQIRHQLLEPVREQVKSASKARASLQPASAH